MDVIRASLSFLHRTAIASNTTSYRYADILGTALRICSSLHPPVSGDAVPLEASAARQTFESHPRVALMCEPGAEYVAGTLAAWLQRSIAVPLCLSHPDRELQYVLEDAGVGAVLATPGQAERMRRLATPLGAAVHELSTLSSSQTEELQSPIALLLSRIMLADPALIVYTSGTTGRPKGVLHTHAGVCSQIHTLNAAWEWSADDRILHTLPLHHVHGIVNALFCPLAAGAAVEFVPKFSPKKAWARLQRAQDPVTVFMATPTHYSFLLNTFDGMAAAEQQSAGVAAARLRLAVSGSAACPLPVMRRWAELSGQPLLERYGMTETGMILGNPLHGERRPGTVGIPFQGVEVRLVPHAADDQTQQTMQPRPVTAAGAKGSGPSGELRVRSAQLFSCYWHRPEDTAAAFDDDGFFLTGDTADVDERGYYRLLGRTSVDIIKRGGYKISALHVECALLEHPDISECAVVGLPDGEYGEQIAAVVAARQGVAAPSLEDLQTWAAERLPAYSLPTKLRVVPEMRRNAMGKVNKKALRAEAFPDAFLPVSPAA